jgi:hypothetical protein
MFDSSAHQWKQPAWAGVKQQRLIGDDKILVEREADIVRDRNRRVDPVDAIGDFADIGAGLLVGHGHRALLPSFANIIARPVFAGNGKLLQIALACNARLLRHSGLATAIAAESREATARFPCPRAETYGSQSKSCNRL